MKTLLALPWNQSLVRTCAVAGGREAPRFFRVSLQKGGENVSNDGQRPGNSIWGLREQGTLLPSETVAETGSPFAGDAQRRVVRLDDASQDGEVGQPPVPCDSERRETLLSNARMDGGDA